MQTTGRVFELPRQNKQTNKKSSILVSKIIKQYYIEAETLTKIYTICVLWQLLFWSEVNCG